MHILWEHFTLGIIFLYFSSSQINLDKECRKRSESYYVHIVLWLETRSESFLSSDLVMWQEAARGQEEMVEGVGK